MKSTPKAGQVVVEMKRFPGATITKWTCKIII